ncbi:hypothetical protein B0H13DRAFT_2365435 [Mycena leptocephala]|nr:hypothetical protein B0H13DRAFT_2365435 [Mycena leptocephala]
MKNMKLAEAVSSAGTCQCGRRLQCSEAAVQRIWEKPGLIDLDEGTIDAEVLDWLDITTDNLRTSGLSRPTPLRCMRRSWRCDSQ